MGGESGKRQAGPDKQRIKAYSYSYNNLNQRGQNSALALSIVTRNSDVQFDNEQT